MITALTTSFCLSLVFGLLIIATKNFHGRFSFDSTVGVQKFHFTPTPRVGGLGLFLGILFGSALLPDLSPKFVCIIFFSSLVLIIGLMEDITKNVKPIYRFSLILIFAIVTSNFTDIWITSLRIYPIDLLLNYSVIIKVLITAIAVTGLTNAINIIDGFHGLAAGTSVISFVGFYFLSVIFGDTEMAGFCLVIIFAILGFLTLNFPLGKIFLGDGGSYSLGFLLSFVAISITIRNPEISPWASLTVCAYPIIETLFSMYRKTLRAGHHPGQPDKVHLHMLVFRRFISQHFSISNQNLKNSFTSIFLWIFQLLFILPALFWPSKTFNLCLLFLLFTAAYLFLYRKLTQFKWF